MSHQGMSSDNSKSLYGDERLVGDFCDAIIKVKDVEIPVHKVILCKCSPYFRALFTRWSTPEKNVFTIPGPSPDTMRLIIKFAYTGSVSLTVDNVQDVLMAADQFNIMELIQTCCHFLEEQLCPNNCIGIWQFTNIYLCPELQHKAFCYIITHFEEVIHCYEFLQLSLQELIGFLERDDLNVREERTLFEGVIHWVNFFRHERLQSITEVLSKVRLALINEEYIRLTVLPSELILRDPDCLLMVSDALRIKHHMLTNRPSVTGFRNPIARPRLPNTILLAIGGWSRGDPTSSIEAYDVCTDRWINVTNNAEHPRAYHGTAFLNGSIYCVGGFDRVEYFNSMCRLDLSTHRWHEAAPMYHRRCYVSVTVLNGCIYAMGGYDGHVRLSSAECYRPDTNQWTVIASMHEQRSDACCTTLHNKIYICGGFNGSECLQTSEFYNPLTNEWTMIAPMNSRRSGIGVIAYADHIYAVGGFDGSSRLHSAEAYNPHTNNWHAVSNMLTPRSNFGIAVIDNRLFAVGGFNGFTTSYNVEYYDGLTSLWHEACNMEIFRSALSCCVVPRFPNMASYVVPRDTLPFLNEEDDYVESGESNSPEQC